MALINSSDFDLRRSQLLNQQTQPPKVDGPSFSQRRSALIEQSPLQQPVKNEYFSGSVINKLGDLLSTGQFFSAGLAKKFVGQRKEQTVKEAIVSGVKERASYVDIFNEVFPYKASASVSANFFKGLLPTTLGVLSDIFLDPTLGVSRLRVIPKAVEKIGKTIKPATEAVGKAPILGKTIKEWVITRANQPALFQQLDKDRIIKEFLGRDGVAQMVKPVIELPSAVQIRVAQVIKGGITTREEIASMARPIRAELDRVGESISKLSPALLSPETFVENAGKYFPRLYKKFEFSDIDAAIKSWFPQKPLRVPGQRFLKRKDIPEEIRKTMEEILEAGYPAFKGLTQLKEAEARLQFFTDVAKNFASDIPSPELFQLPKSAKLGELSGKFVEKPIFNAIQEIRRIPTEGEKLYLGALRTWKAFKTAYNPATIARNDLTNFFILNPLGGVNPWRLDIYARTTHELLSGGAYYEKFKQMGGLLTSQEAAELQKKSADFYTNNRGLINGVFGTFKKFHQKVVDFYGSQDRFFKLANFIKGVTEDGLTAEESMRRAQLYLIDYSEVPELVKVLRKSPVGIPFISFTYGVSKPLAKTLLENPEKLSAIFKIIRGIQSMNPRNQSEDELQKEAASLPRWISGGEFLRLPYPDSEGRSQYLDMQYILPFNPIEPRSLSLGQNPLFSTLATLTTGVDPFTNREIYKKTDTKKEQFDKSALYVWRQLAPSLAPGGWSFTKLYTALTKQPYNGSVRNIGQALLDVFAGLKITPIDVGEEEQKRAKERSFQINELRKEIRSINRSNSLTPKQKADKTKQLRLRMQSISASP